MGWDFSNVNVQSDVSNESLDSGSVLEPGWYKFQLVAIGDTNPASSGKAEGGTWTFEVVDGGNKGIQFSVWLASKVIDSKYAFMLKRTTLLAQRLAQVCGIYQITDPSMLLNKPFWALVKKDAREYASKKEVDTATGLPKMEKKDFNDFASGKLGETILSCNEYAQKYGNGGSGSGADFEFRFN